MTPQVKELYAQVLYRLERYEECFDVYRDIIKNTDDEYEEERTTNLSAVVANLAIDGSVISFFLIFFMVEEFFPWFLIKFCFFWDIVANFWLYWSIFGYFD